MMLSPTTQSLTVSDICNSGNQLIDSMICVYLHVEESGRILPLLINAHCKD